MSHHGTELSDALKQANEVKENLLGATGQYPDGKMNEQDLGEVAMGIAVVEGKLVLDFGPQPIHWIGFTKKETIDLVKILNNKIAEL